MKAGAFHLKIVRAQSVILAILNERKPISMNCLRCSSGKLLSLAVLMLMTFGYGHGLEEKVCSNRSLEGSFGFTISGTNAVAGPFAIVGSFDVDGRGNISGAGTEAIVAVIGPNQAFTGTYNVDTNCKGTALLTFTDSGLQTHLSFVLVDDGKEAMIIVTDRGTVEFGAAKKQFARSEHSE